MGVASRCYVTGPGTAVVNTAFSVALLSTDNFDVPTAVSQDTYVLLTVFSGTGLLFGTLTGVILTGQSAGTILGVLYSKVENGVELWAGSTSGDALASFLNGTTINFSAITYYSEPDCRATSTYPALPNTSRSVNGTLIYDVQTSSNSAVPGTDSRTALAPVACGTYPQNSRTPGTYGPGE
jgi:hypothetical protein